MNVFFFFLTQVSVGKKEKSKGLFYKAIQNCPWTKVSIEKNKPVISTLVFEVLYLKKKNN